MTMKNIVIFKTAKALDEVGYPQPEFETGQIWYDTSGNQIFIGPNGGLGDKADMLAHHRYVFLIKEGARKFQDPAEFCAFYAPSATEIMEHIGNEHPGARLYFDGGLWNAFDGWRNLSPNHKNPAEAAAQLFILLNK